MGATVDRQELEREAAEAAERQREAIRAAFAAGWRPREIGAITGLSRQRIYEITKESR
jgi:DNA-directed RNA polymerase specialized sigma24 family protein